MKVIIAGSRGIKQDDIIETYIKQCPFKITEIVSGTAQGVDQLGERYAFKNKIPLKQFPADWNTHRRSAGYIRNVEMAKYADALVAIWDGESKGTQHMVGIMQEKNKPVFLVTLDGEPTTIEC